MIGFYAAIVLALALLVMALFESDKAAVILSAQ